MQDFPAADALLDSVAGYLLSELRPLVPAEERFRVLVAAHVCAVVARELRADGASSKADATLFAELLGAGREGVRPAGRAEPTGGHAAREHLDDARALATELAAAIRAGEFDDNLDVLIARLPEHVRRKLEVARPGYAE